MKRGLATAATGTRPTLAWAVTEPIGGGNVVIAFTIDVTRSGAIRKLTDRYPEGARAADWGFWRRRGYRAARVEIREVER